MAIFGAQPYGPGTPAVSASVRGTVRKNPQTGGSSGSRRLDPKTRDYVRDSATGRLQGMTNAQQLVYIAVQTELGSSAVRSLGNTLRRIKRIGPALDRAIDMDLRRCVRHLVTGGIIEVVDTIVRVVRPGVVIVQLRWRDVSDSTEDTTNVGEFAVQE